VAGLTELAAWNNGVLPFFEFIGGLFIRLITMIVIPLVVASLLLGVASLGDLRQLGRIGGKTIAYYLTTTAIAVTIGLTLANWVKPGSRISAETRDSLAAQFTGQAQERVAQAGRSRGVGIKPWGKPFWPRPREPLFGQSSHRFRPSL
jgi:Na+/H+-dicarboxylate symporter